MKILLGQNHWMLVEISMTHRLITSFDSMPNYTSSYYRDLMNRLVINLLTVGIDCQKFSMKRHLNCSRQTNSFDCGIMSLLFLKYRLEGRPMDNISYQDASNYRFDCARFLFSTTAHGQQLLRTLKGNLEAALLNCTK